MLRVLELQVDTKLQWRRDSLLLLSIDELSMTRRQVHSLLGGWLAHFPVSGWLRVVCAFLQRSTAKDGVAWDARVSDETMICLRDTISMLAANGDPAHGQWLVSKEAPLRFMGGCKLLSIALTMSVLERSAKS